MAESKTGARVKHESLTGRKGAARTLDFAERVSVWGKYCEGSNVFDLAIEFLTTPAEIESAVSRTAAELGFPHNHVDPELERFRILEASDRMKTALVRSLKESDQILNDINSARNEIRGEKSLKELETPDRKAWLDLVEVRQSEMKLVTSLLAEYRTTNLLIADLMGIKRTKPQREPKKVVTDEERMEVLSEAELREMVQGTDEENDESHI